MDDRRPLGAVEHDQLILIHTPHLQDKVRGTRRTLDVLRNMNVDIIKIDRIFIERIDTSVHDRELVRAVIDFAHVAGMEATAEGVETAAQVECLRKIGCDNLQGFYYSRPLDADMVDQLVHHRPASSRNA